MPSSYPPGLLHAVGVHPRNHPTPMRHLYCFETHRMELLNLASMKFAIERFE